MIGKFENINIIMTQYLYITFLYFINMKHKDKIILRLVKRYNKNKRLMLIDLGAGGKPFQKVLPRNINYESSDIDPACNPDILCDLNKKFPIKNKVYDFVICTEVLEHVLNPVNTIKEIKRITKDDGFIIISLPNEYNLYLRLKFLLGIQNNTEIPFRNNLGLNHIHKPRVKDIIKLYKSCLNIKEILYSWDSFSDKKFNWIIDVIIRNFLMPISKNLFSRSVIVIGNKKT